MNKTVDWLLMGDVSIQYLTNKYLLKSPPQVLVTLRNRIALEGFGKAFLEARNPSGHWGLWFYQPKWTSSHYTIIDLRYLEIEPVKSILETLWLILDKCRFSDGSISESRPPRPGDVCVNGMFLNYASFFEIPEETLKPIVDYILKNQVLDGGFNCEFNRRGAVHSSMHTTICVLEGILEFTKAGYQYRYEDLLKAKGEAEEFLLEHQLYKSDKTGEIIDQKWTRLSYPSRWRYDILRALIYFVDANTPYDKRMKSAIDLLLSKKRKDGTWPVQAKHPGQVHFDMEETGTPSRFNTIRALRVLNTYLPEIHC